MSFVTSVQQTALIYRYKYNVDKEMVQLKFVSAEGKPLGVINWYAVHGTSMNSSNCLVTSDNVGYASILFEKDMNEDGTPIGKASQNYLPEDVYVRNISCFSDFC